MHSTVLCILCISYNRPDIFRPPRSILIPNAVTSTALSFIMYFIYLRVISEPSEPNAYIEPQGIAPVRSPTISGRAAKRRRAPAVTEQNELCCGMSERNPGSSPHMFMPMTATKSPIIVKAMLFACTV